MTKHFSEDMGENYGTAGFFAREKPNPIDWSTFNINPEKDWPDDTEAVVLQPIWFFHKEQKITLGNLREFFTPKAIKLFEKDGYIKLNIDHGEPEV